MKKEILFKSMIFGLCLLFPALILTGQTNWEVKSTTNSPLVHNIVTKLYQDSHGDMWVGTRGGLNQIKGDDWEAYTKNNGMPHKSIIDIGEDDKGNIWVGTFKGIALYDGENWTYFNKDNGLVNNKIYAVESDSKGNIWIGTKKGVSVYDGENWKTYTKNNGLIHNWVLDIMEDQDGNIWFATQKGVSVYDGQNWKSFNKNDGLARSFVWSIAEDGSGKIWIGTHTGAFSTYDGSNWELIKKGKGYYDASFVLLGVVDGLLFAILLGPVAGGVVFVLTTAAGALPSAANATRVYVDSGDNVWLAAQPKGAYMFDGKNWTEYNNKNGMPHKRVNDFLETNDGEMWLGTSKGIAIMK